MKKQVKAVVLFSGGLDSRLAIKLLQEQGIEVIALHIDLPFGEGCCKKYCSFNFSQMQGVKLEIIDCTKGKLFQEYIKLLRKPKYGRGAGMNHCIDCHIFILKLAKKFTDKNKINIIATGEVLDERPMSQRIKGLKIVEEESGLKGRLLRPLSAKLLEETEAEKKGLIDRNKLLALRGRQRNIQFELAKKYNIKFPSPAGGCVLCEKDFARKLEDLFKHNKKISESDIELLKLGRNFRIKNIKIVIGRREEENKKLQELAKTSKNFIVMEAKDIPSPVTIIEGKPAKEEIKKAAEITARYADCEKECIVVYEEKGKKKEIKAKKASDDEIESLRI